MDKKKDRVYIEEHELSERAKKWLARIQAETKDIPEEHFEEIREIARNRT